MHHTATRQELEQQIQALQERLREAEETLNAIRHGEVDAVVVSGGPGEQVFTLRGADHPYRLLVQSMNEGALILSSEGFIVYANNEFSRLVDLPLSAVLGISVRQFVDPADAEMFEVLFQRCQNRPSRGEIVLRGLARAVDVQLSLTPMMLDEPCICVVATDLTERKRNQELNRAEALARSILEQVTEAVVVTDAHLNITRASQAARVLAGKELLLKPFHSAFLLQIESSQAAAAGGGPPAAGDQLTFLRRALQGQPLGALEGRVFRDDGTSNEVLVSAGPLRGAAGDIIGAVVTLTIVDELKRAQAAVRDSERRFRQLADSVPQIVWTTADNSAAIDYANARWFSYSGRKPSDAGALDWPALVHEEDAPQVEAAWQAAVADSRDLEIEFRLRRAQDRAYRWHLCRAVAMRDLAGQPIRWFLTATDIDDRKRHTVEAERTNHALRVANEDLRQFAYAASHDLQEPLRMISTFTELLVRTYRDRLDDRASQMAVYILEGTARMNLLLRDLLAYSARSGAFEIPASTITDAAGALEFALGNLRSSLESCGASVDAGFLPAVACQEAHLVELFQNLLANSVKYRGKESPRIRVWAERVDGEWVFAVADNGIGIAPAYHNQIFGLFKRLHGRDIPGTGIGLALCQKIVEGYGGRIWVESEPGKGATFRFTLPVPGEHTRT